MNAEQNSVDYWRSIGNQLKDDIYFFTQHFFLKLNGKLWQKSPHFEMIAGKLNSILNGTHPTNNLIINMPPRAGKTQMSIINFTALGFAFNPASEFMMLSTSDLLTLQNVTNIRQIMQHEQYKLMFPDTVITNTGNSGITTSAGGKLYAAPFMGQIVGFGCGKLGADTFSGAMLIDDPVKTQDALSETIRERVNFTWANTIISRKNDAKTPVIITAQRTHEHDLCGFLLEEEGTVEEGGKWDLLKLPAITEDAEGNDVSIWEERMPLEYLRRLEKLDPWVFGTQYMQDPKPIEGLLFPSTETVYFEYSPEPDMVFIEVDPADCGGDAYCSKVYHIKDGIAYVVDCIYSRDPFEVVFPRQIEQIARTRASQVRIEAVSAWMIAANRIIEKCDDLGLDVEVLPFKVHANKELRILNLAPVVRNHFVYLHPSLQNDEYRAMMKEKHSYLKNVKDQHDDGVDTDAAAAYWMCHENYITPEFGVMQDSL